METRIRTRKDKCLVNLQLNTLNIDVHVEAHLETLKNTGYFLNAEYNKVSKRTEAISN